ncbi:hypothetical protein J6590_027298 [Homalodisca vitripennis]|nr:hypothetical protein J6590_027298 [Homalodisca vitripennis]
MHSVVHGVNGEIASNLPYRCSGFTVHDTVRGKCGQTTRWLGNHTLLSFPTAL